MKRSPSAAVTFLTAPASSSPSGQGPASDAGRFPRASSSDVTDATGSSSGSFDIDEAAVHQRPHDVGGLEDGEATLGGQVGDVAVAVDLAEQRPVGAGQADVGRPIRTRGQHGDSALAADRLDQLTPPVPTHLDLGEQLTHRHRWRDVLPGLLGLAELVGGDRPLEQRGHGVSELFDDEGLDHRTFDIAQVDQQLAEPPALELVGLDVERGGARASGDRSPDADRSGCRCGRASSWTRRRDSDPSSK